jgi:hypothetical protein
MIIQGGNDPVVVICPFLQRNQGQRHGHPSFSKGKAMKGVKGSGTSSEEAQAASVLTNLDDARAAKLGQKRGLAAALLRPAPETLNVTGEQVAIDIITTTETTEFFRAHASLRLTLPEFNPRPRDLDSGSYAVLPEAEPLLLRYKVQPTLVTLFPIVIGSTPPVHKLMRIKHPRNGRRWDNFNLTRKLCLDRSVGEWLAIRVLPSGGGYQWDFPDPEAKFSEPTFPDWDEDEWLQRSYGAKDLILPGDLEHEVFKALRGLIR